MAFTAHLPRGIRLLLSNVLPFSTKIQGYSLFDSSIFSQFKLAISDALKPVDRPIKMSPFGKQGILSFFEFSHKEKQNLVYVLVD